MKFGFNTFSLINVDATDYVAVAKRAEELGYESLFLPDHLIFPMKVPATYPYATGGEPPWQGDSNMYDPWVFLGHLAAVTSKIKLGTNVYILPLRDPIVVARAVMTLDRLSNGRAVLGAGVGWLKDEFDMVGRDWHTRGAIMDEAIMLLKQLWTQRVTEFRGKHLSYGPVMFEPKPVQKPHPPIYIGGVSMAAMKRAARVGDGWMAVSGDFATVRGQIQTVKDLLREHGREKEPFSITVSGANATLDLVRRYEELGVDRMTVSVTPHKKQATAREFLDGLDRFSHEIMAKGDR